METDSRSGYDRLYGHATIELFTKEVEILGYWADPTWRPLVVLHAQCSSELRTDSNDREWYANNTSPNFERPYNENHVHPDDQHFWSKWYALHVKEICCLGGLYGAEVSNQVASATMFGKIWDKAGQVNEYRNFSKAYPDGLRWVLLSLQAMGVTALERNETGKVAERYCPYVNVEP